MAFNVKTSNDAGDMVFKDADGNQIFKINSTNSSVEMKQELEHHTSADTLTVEESGSHHTNLGATGAVALTLPQDATAGVFFDFTVMVAQELRLEPSSAGGIYIGGAKQTDNLYVTANAINESLRMTSLGNGDWFASKVVGTWTVEGA